MKLTSLRRGVLPGIAAITLIAASACSASNESDSGSAGDGESADLSGTLSAGGASSQQAAQAAWAAGFSSIAPDVTVNYDPLGSGGGRENFISGGFPFAGSDAYLTDDEGELSDAAERCGGDPIEVPNYISPIAVAYNLPDFDGDLQLSPETLAGIMAGDITEWDDEAIAADNEGADLPAERINAIHRSDESGTTENFTDYLDAVAGDVWTAGVVETWPGDAGGEGAKGTSGVVETISNSDYSIGYADASQTADLSQALIGVGDSFESPSAAAAAQVLEVSDRVEDRPDVDMAIDINHETDEAGVYPIVLVSYLIACQEYEDAEEGALVQAYLSYILSEDGQQQGADEAGSAPLSDSLREEAEGIVENIS